MKHGSSPAAHRARCFHPPSHPMSQLLYKFSLESAKFNTEVLTAILLIWAAVLSCALASVTGQPFTSGQRRFWIAVIVCFPVVGMLAYLPFSIRKEDLPEIFLLKRERQKRERELEDRKRLGGGEA